MGKAMRKPRPSMPHWWWLYEQCALCRNKNNCNQCKMARIAGKNIKKLGKKRDKLGLQPKEESK